MRILPLVLLAACSLGRNPSRCADTQECRDAFGLGSVCAADGFCELPDAPVRCLSTEPTDVFNRPEKYADAIVVGGLFDHSTDLPQVNSALLAVAQANDLGGLDGREFVSVSCTYEENTEFDDSSPQEAALDLTAYLVDVLGAQAIVGPATSDRSFDAYAVASEAGAVVMSPSATSPELTSVDGDVHSDEAPGLFWRTVPPDDLQGVVMALDITNRGVTNVGVVHEESSYASALADVFEAEYGGTVTRFSFDNPTTRSEAITDVGNAGVEEVVFLSSEATDHVAFFEAAAVSADFNDVDPIEIFLADAGSDPFILANTADVADVLYDRVRGTRPKIPDGEVFEQFQAAYASVFGEDPSDAVFAPYTYDAGWLVVYGHAWSHFQEGEISGLGIARGLRKISDPAGGELPVRPGSWDIVLEKFEAGVSVDLEGASGPLDFDPITGETAVAIEVYVINQAGTGFEPVTVCEVDGTCTPL